MSATPAASLVDMAPPSLRQLQNIIREKEEIEVKLMTGELMSGRLFWQDMDCICLLAPNGQRTIIWKHAIGYLRPTGEIAHGGGPSKAHAQAKAAAQMPSAPPAPPATVISDADNLFPFS
jgi:host factor-I protein